MANLTGYLQDKNGNKLDISESKSVIMVTLTDTNPQKAVNAPTAWVNYRIPYNNVLYNIGDKFTLNGNVVQYTGNRPVKATVHIQRGDQSSSNLYPYTGYNDSAQEYCSAASPYAQMVNVYTNRVNFDGWFCSSASGTVYFRAAPSTFMLLEEL